MPVHTVSRLVLLFGIAFVFAGCLDLAEHILVGADSKITMKTEIRLDPMFFAKAKERNYPAISSTDSVRTKLLEGFKTRMMIFDTLAQVEEFISNVTVKDSMTVITAELIVTSPNDFPVVNRLFWSSAVNRPRTTPAIFPIDFVFKKKADTLTAFDVSAVAAKYQQIFKLTDAEIEDVDSYLDYFKDKVARFSFSAERFVGSDNKDAKKLDRGISWTYPQLDAILYGRSTFKPFTIVFGTDADTSQYRYQRQ